MPLNAQRFSNKGDSQAKYLLKYAEPECASILNAGASLPTLGKTYCVVIPAYKETPQCVARLLSHPHASELLIVLVINQPPSAPATASSTNTHLWRWLLEQGRTSWTTKTCTQTEAPASTAKLALIETASAAILCVDRFTLGRTIAEDQGVGLARKLGADLAVALFAQQAFSHPVIFSTDADAHLPANYFAAQQQSFACNSASSAWVYDYTHNSTGNSAEDTEICQATQSYEQAIKYYRNGLEWAGSAYGFHTLGSTLAVSIAHYCQVRGFPKRAAGEDFYLLNKLAKVGTIKNINNSIIEIDARTSDRVPFGTGPAAQKIISQWHNEQQYHYYHPQCFTLLKSLLDNQVTIWQAIQTGRTPLFINNELDTENQALINNALTALNIQRFVSHASKQTRDEKQFRRQFHDWFDAFSTLKFIRFIAANKYSDLPLQQCLARAPFNQG